MRPFHLDGSVHHPDAARMGGPLLGRCLLRRPEHGGDNRRRPGRPRGDQAGTPGAVTPRPAGEPQTVEDACTPRHASSTSFRRCPGYDAVLLAEPELTRIPCARSEVGTPPESDTIVITAADIFPDPN
jgi:hypothetical protein